MPGDEPGEHEEAEHDVATQRAPHIFHHLGQLRLGTCIREGMQNNSKTGAYMH